MSDASEGLVSVIMPFLAARPFIAEAIESVRAQTYAAWELLLVDDGSTDGTADVARGYAEREPERIRLLRHPDGGNHGASAARNVGLAEARGEFVAFLDADDYWLPENLAEQVGRLRAVPEAGLLCSRTLYWFSWNGDAAARDFSPSLRIHAGLVTAPRLLESCLAGRAPVPCTCSILVRRSVLEQTGGFEEHFPLLYDDQAFYAKLFTVTNVLLDEGCWARYRRHPGSMTVTAEREEQYRPARLAYLTWLQRYLEGYPAAHAALRSTLRRELWRCRHPIADRLLDQGFYLRRRLQRFWSGW